MEGNRASHTKTGGTRRKTAMKPHEVRSMSKNSRARLILLIHLTQQQTRIAEDGLTDPTKG